MTKQDKKDTIDKYWIEQLQEEYNRNKNRTDISIVEKLQPLVMMQTLLYYKMEIELRKAKVNE